MSASHGTRPTTLVLALVVVAAAAALLPRLSAAAGDVTGRWSGTFEFVVLGERAVFGPAASLESKRRGDGDTPPRFGEGDLTVTVENQFDDHFFGRWTAAGRSADIVCTMMDESRFLCSGKKASVLGEVLADDRMRMCWSASGEAATTGCAELARPQ